MLSVTGTQEPVTRSAQTAIIINSAERIKLLIHSETIQLRLAAWIAEEISGRNERTG